MFEAVVAANCYEWRDRAVAGRPLFDAGPRRCDEIEIGHEPPELRGLVVLVSVVVDEDGMNLVPGHDPRDLTQWGLGSAVDNADGHRISDRRGSECDRSVCVEGSVGHA